MPAAHLPDPVEHRHGDRGGRGSPLVQARPSPPCALPRHLAPPRSGGGGAAEKRCCGSLSPSGGVPAAPHAACLRSGTRSRRPPEQAGGSERRSPGTAPSPACAALR
ncbi:unnamed protein product [Prorocentrum cordatum]|uniref:Uncharacterized protein n=1 Tax=Prorocentrum cordatum TaxID=2364126 RepID=A0ABN9RI14_9DINO|nr:unnamed protein product [Polarella glacialis]